MFIKVTVKSSAKTDKIEKSTNGNYKIHTKQPSLDGKANQSVVAILSDYFKVPQNCIRIKAGLRSKIKIVEIVID